ncbi:MAG TPA: hypothetical protein VGI39_41240 [Polyangiaceae bacterium]|jgi:hypothetical protein
MPDPNQNAEFRTMVDRSLKSDRIAILGSGFVAILGLAVSTYNVYLQRVQIRAQVWPHLESLRSDARGFEWALRNTGVGPASLQGARVSLDGVPMKNWDEVCAAVTKKSPRVMESVNRSEEAVIGRVIPAGASIEPLKLEFAHQDEAWKTALAAAFSSLDVELCYCSTLDECWLSHQLQANRVGSCSMDRLTWRE